MRKAIASRVAELTALERSYQDRATALLALALRAVEDLDLRPLTCAPRPRLEQSGAPQRWAGLPWPPVRPWAVA